MYRDISISQRIDKLGELLAKGIYLYLEKEKADKAKMDKKTKADEPAKDQTTL